MIEHDRIVIHPKKQHTLAKVVGVCKKLCGAMAEVGVYRGGSARIIASVDPDSTLYLFDTFKGIPNIEPDQSANINFDFSKTSVEAVAEYLKDLKNVSIHAGVFPRDTAHAVEHERFKFVFIDVDTYESCRDALLFFIPRMVKSGRILIDDFEDVFCPGVKRAIYEVVKDLRVHPLGNNLAMIVKT